MSILFPRGQPPNGDGIEGGDPGNASTTDSDSGSILSNQNTILWSASTEAVKWGVIAGIFIIFLLFITLATWHARRRMRSGLQPLPYHRWLVARRNRMQYLPRHENNPSFYAHDMHPYAVPPPAYNAEHDYVPAYTPEDCSKIKMKVESTTMSTEGGPSQPPPVANPPRPMYT